MQSEMFITKNGSESMMRLLPPTACQRMRRGKKCESLKRLQFRFRAYTHVMCIRSEYNLMNVYVIRASSLALPTTAVLLLTNTGAYRRGNRRG